jgi:tRNA threonylcarbamoyladenosine biosynthesis protein TsaE
VAGLAAGALDLLRLDEEGLTRWGERVGDTLKTPALIALSGALGAGKSVLARAIGRGGGVQQAMPSPSFNLLFRYRTSSGVEVVHMDLYRLQSPDELWELGWEELGGRDEIVLLEWPERAGDLLPGDYWLVELSIPADAPGRREVSATRVGDPPDLAGFPMTVSEGS